ncbi:MAG: hypothetical protein MJZ34_07765 [Paludibacteraceae bacterium]|nr:hypothetical protein [Paludibacteraceae bacterium]
MNMWLVMEHFVYFDATIEEKKTLYDWVQKDYVMLIDLIYIMRKRAEEEVMGDCEALAKYMEEHPEEETVEVGYMERDPNGSYGKLRGIFDDERKLAKFVKNFNKYLSTD